MEDHGISMQLHAMVDNGKSIQLQAVPHMADKDKSWQLCWELRIWQIMEPILVGKLKPIPCPLVD